MSATTKLRSMAVPYQLLLERVEDSIKLRNLLSELLFMVLYATFFLVFVALQAQTESVYDVNSALHSTFGYRSFPSSSGDAMTFEQIRTPENWLTWFNDVALSTVLTSRYSSAIGQSQSPTTRPTRSPTRSPLRPTRPQPPTRSPFDLSVSPTTSPTTLSKAPSTSPVSDIIETQQPSVSPELPAEARRILQDGNSTTPSASPSVNGTEYVEIRSKELTFFAVLWQKRVKQQIGSTCVQAPNFLWNSLTMLNAPFGTVFPSSNSPSSSTCFAAYSPNAENTQDSSLFPVLKYYSNSPIHASAYVGAVQTNYPSNGYYSSRITTGDFASEWANIEPHFITSGTRLLAVSVLTYNPTYNMWASISMFTEILESGQMATSMDVETGPLMYCASSQAASCTDDSAEMVMATLTAVFIILHFIFIVVVRRCIAFYRIVFTSGRRGKGEVLIAWLKDIFRFWVMLDIAQCVLGIITLSYISKVYWSLTRYNELIKIPLDSMTIGNAATINSYLVEFVYMQQIFGSQIILFNIQVFKYFPALPCFTLVRMGWYNAYKETINVFVMYWVIIIVYAFVGWTAFGQVLVGYGSMAMSIQQVIHMILGESNFDSMRRISPQFAWVYLVFFIIVFVYFLQALFLSVVIEGFRLAFRSLDMRQSSGPGVREVIGKVTRNDYAMSNEYAARLRAWKALKANKNVVNISWSQLRAALQGHVHNRMDITDETVDDVFRLVKSVELKASTGKEDKAENSAGGDASGTLLMPQLLKTMFEVKANERTLLKHVGIIMKQMRKSQDDAEALIRKADAASTKFAKDD